MYGKTTTPHTSLEYISSDVTLSKKNKLVESIFPMLMIAVGISGLVIFLTS